MIETLLKLYYMMITNAMFLLHIRIYQAPDRNIDIQCHVVLCVSTSSPLLC